MSQYEDWEHERLSAWAHKTWMEAGQVHDPNSKSVKSSSADIIGALVIASAFGIPALMVIASDNTRTTAKVVAGIGLVFILVVDLLALLGIQLPKDGWN